MCPFDLPSNKVPQCSEVLDLELCRELLFGVVEEKAGFGCKRNVIHKDCQNDEALVIDPEVQTCILFRLLKPPCASPAVEEVSPYLTG